MKTGNCSKMENLSPREQLVFKMRAINSLKSNEKEEWVPLSVNPQYLISSHGRVKNNKSYGHKPRFLTPSLRKNKYLCITITVSCKRRTMSLTKLLIQAFPMSC